MPVPYSQDLRKRIVDAYMRGEGSYRQLAARFSVSRDTVSNYVTAFKSSGHLKPLPHAGGNPTQKLFDEHWLQIQQWLTADPNLMWPQVADQVKEHFGITIDPSQLSRINKKRGWTRKKTPNATQELATPSSKLSAINGELV